MTDFDNWWEDYYDYMFDGVGNAATEYEAAQEAWKAAEPEWQPVETAPENKHVLACFEDERGNKTIVKAVLRSRFFEEADMFTWDDSEHVDYCEEAETYYCPAGWYEVWHSHPEWGCYWMNGEKPTHWMPLTEVPHD